MGVSCCAYFVDEILTCVKQIVGISSLVRCYVALSQGHEQVCRERDK